LQRLNPNASAGALAEALRKIDSPEHVVPMLNNRAFHQMLVNGLEVEVLVDGDVRGERIVLADFDNPENNTWLAVNQYTITGSVERRPDVVVFLNGLPVAVIELKNAADDQATIEKAYQQLQTY
jgi:type I restriction enzyme, R subunit